MRTLRASKNCQTCLLFFAQLEIFAFFLSSHNTWPKTNFLFSFLPSFKTNQLEFETEKKRNFCWLARNYFSAPSTNSQSSKLKLFLLLLLGCAHKSKLIARSSTQPCDLNAHCFSLSLLAKVRLICMHSHEHTHTHTKCFIQDKKLTFTCCCCCCCFNDTRKNLSWLGKKVNWPQAQVKNTHTETSKQ